MKRLLLALVLVAFVGCAENYEMPPEPSKTNAIFNTPSGEHSDYPSDFKKAKETGKYWVVQAHRDLWHHCNVLSANIIKFDNVILTKLDPSDETMQKILRKDLQFGGHQNTDGTWRLISPRIPYWIVYKYDSKTKKFTAKRYSGSRDYNKLKRIFKWKNWFRFWFS